jgi:uncharacterized protein
MKLSERVERYRASIRQVVEANKGANPRVFGSVARGDDTEESDLDLLVESEPGMTLFNIGAIRHEVATLIGAPVDVVTLGSIPPAKRSRILAEAKPL